MNNENGKQPDSSDKSTETADWGENSNGEGGAAQEKHAAFAEYDYDKDQELHRLAMIFLGATALTGLIGGGLQSRGGRALERPRYGRR